VSVEGTAEVVTTGRVFLGGVAAEVGTTLAAIPEAVADALVAAGVAERYDG
jgi:hypothetical protein